MSFGTLIDSQISRRSLLLVAASTAAGIGLGVRPLTGFAANAPGAGLPGIDDPDECLRLYLKLTSDLSGKPVIGWQEGILYGVMPGQITRPILGLAGFGTGSVHRQPDGSYQSLWKEVLYYTDLNTGEILETWRNPYNNVQCDVMHVHNGSVNMTLRSHVADMAAVKARSGAEFGYSSVQTELDPAHPFFLPTTVIGDTVTMFSDARGHVKNKLDPKIWPRESTGETYEVGEFYMNSCSLKQLLDKRRSTVPSHGNWNRLSPWLPWMMMGGQQGQLFYRSITHKLTSTKELPARIRSYTEKRYPEFLVPPTDFSIPMETSWDVFMRERKPAPPL